MKELLIEVSLNTRKMKMIIDAIKNRHPITFYYKGPKGEVKTGTRVRGEGVLLGLSKRGNTLLRMFVEPPSVSKRGFEEHGWRTFNVKRMSNINIDTEITFDNKRPLYKEGDENGRSPIIKTLFATDWGQKATLPEPKKPEIEEPKVEPKKVDTSSDLPQPKEKPSLEPEIEEPVITTATDTQKYNDLIRNNVNSIIHTINSKKYLTTDEYNTIRKELYSLMQKTWQEKQRKKNKQTKPGMGTRRKFDIDSNNELSKYLNREKVTVVNFLPQEKEELNEEIKRIKTLMFFKNII